ncbi:MAG: glycosyltransferase [Acidobacteria bacterium]|nr:glycosyltransferase [Acidobacteriota bacterium]
MPAVVRIITRLNIGGPSIQAIRLTTDLPPLGYETTLLHGRIGEGEGDMLQILPAGAADLRPIRWLCRPVRPLDDLRAFVAIWALLRRLRPAIVHTHMAKAGLLGRLAAVCHNLTAGRARRARIVHTYHGHVLDGYFSAWTTRVFVALERGLARFTDAIVAISPRIRDELAGRFGIGRLDQYRIVPLGLDLSPYTEVAAGHRQGARQALALDQGALVVSTVGRLTAIKNHRLLFAAARLVLARVPRALFVIAGDGELRADLEREASALGIAERVRFLGWRRDLPAVYAASDVVAVTSDNEGTPVALIEAMASGVPGVSTDVGGVADLVRDGVTGLLVPSGRADALAAALERLLTDDGLRLEMGRRARASVAEAYSIQRLVGDIDRLYRSLGAGAGATATP